VDVEEVEEDEAALGGLLLDPAQVAVHDVLRVHPARLEVVEAPVEAVVAVEPGAVAREASGLEAALLVPLRKGHGRRGQDADGLVLTDRPHAVAGVVQPGEHGRVRGQGAVGVGEVVVEHDPLRSEGVEEGRRGLLVAAEAGVVRTQRVQRDEEHALGQGTVLDGELARGAGGERDREGQGEEGGAGRHRGAVRSRRSGGLIRAGV